MAWRSDGPPSHVRLSRCGSGMDAPGDFQGGAWTVGSPAVRRECERERAIETALVSFLGPRARRVAGTCGHANAQAEDGTPSAPFSPPRMQAAPSRSAHRARDVHQLVSGKGGRAEDDGRVV